jgi:hypothetical protein
MLIRNSMANVSSKKDTTASTRTTNHISTPTKQTQLETPSAPMKKYVTRNRSNGSIKTSDESTCESTHTQRNLTQEFDTAFFDESSAAWNQNKRKLGNGMYAYHTRYVTSNKRK